MSTYLSRHAEPQLQTLIATFPAVVLVGPRQVGKTSLAKHLATSLAHPTIYLDLEYPEDFNKLLNPTIFLERYADHTVIIDEVQRRPELFPLLRALIDRQRRPGRFILLGSASPELIRDTSESLAGRVAYFELPPFTLPELPPPADYRSHWLRGGFPESFLAADDATSLAWRENFIQTYLERDLPLLGLRADPMLIRRLWTMVAHLNGQLLNLETLGNSLGISGPTVRRYLDFLESAYLIRRLPPFFANISKRLVKSPKLYLRDTGLLHALLNIGEFGQLLGHPALGASWEAYVVQAIAAQLSGRREMCFFRTHDGAEADVVILNAGQPEMLIEIKFSTTPVPARGFYNVIDELKTSKNLIVCPVEQGYPLTENIEVVGIGQLSQWLTAP